MVKNMSTNMYIIITMMRTTKKKTKLQINMMDQPVIKYQMDEATNPKLLKNLLNLLQMKYSRQVVATRIEEDNWAMKIVLVKNDYQQIPDFLQEVVI